MDLLVWWLTGKLDAGGVVAFGILFTNRVLATKMRASKLSTFLSFWIPLLKMIFTGGLKHFSSTVNIAKDASSNGRFNEHPGIGIFNFSNNKYVACTPPDHLQHLEIANHEFLAHVVAGNLWGSLWDDQHVDSSACFHLLRNGRSRHQIRLQLSRLVATCQVQGNFKWKTQWLFYLTRLVVTVSRSTGTSRIQYAATSHLKCLSLFNLISFQGLKAYLEDELNWLLLHAWAANSKRVLHRVHGIQVLLQARRHPDPPHLWPADSRPHGASSSTSAPP